MDIKEIAIFGKNAISFHIFNVFYRDNDRYNVRFFIDCSEDAEEKITIKYHSRFYPEGIDVVSIGNNIENIKDYLKNDNKDDYRSRIKNIIIPGIYLLDKSYLEMTAYCMASECSVITPGYDKMMIEPKCPFISVLTSSDLSDLSHKLLVGLYRVYYKKNCKPLILMSADHNLYDIIDNSSDVNKNINIMVRNGDHLFKVWKEKGKISDQYYKLLRTLFDSNVQFMIVFDYTKVFSMVGYNVFIHFGVDEIPCFVKFHKCLYIYTDNEIDTPYYKMNYKKANILVHLSSIGVTNTDDSKTYIFCQISETIKGNMKTSEIENLSSVVDKIHEEIKIDPDNFWYQY